MWRIFRRNLDVDLNTCADIIQAVTRLHNFVIDSDKVKLDGTSRNDYGVIPLDRDALGRVPEQNNGFLPAEPISDDLDFPSTSNERRQRILDRVIDLQLEIPRHNIDRNHRNYQGILF